MQAGRGGRQRRHDGVGGGVRGQVAVADPLLDGAHDALDQLAAQPVGGGGHPGVGEQRIGAGHLAAGVGRRVSLGCGGLLAEADGNRTRLTRLPGHVGFRGRGGHQTP